MDAFMRAAWGHIYTQKNAEDHVKRTKQMMAKVGDADSPVGNAAKVVQPGALRMACDDSHPKESAMTPGEIRADIEKHVRRIAPPADFLQRGKELIGTQGRVCLRWPGQRSFCKVVGQSLGGPDASGAWQWLKADRDTRAIVASRFVEEQGSGVTEMRLAYVAGADQLLDPDQPQRWGLLRAVADELHTHVERSEDVRLDQATRDYHLGACWAWYIHLAHPTSTPRHCKAPHDARWPCARDVWGADHSGDLVWAILRLCCLITSFGTVVRSDLFPTLTFREEACPITLIRFEEGAVATFRSLHPCASFNHGTRSPPVPARWPRCG